MQNKIVDYAKANKNLVIGVSLAIIVAVALGAYFLLKPVSIDKLCEKHLKYLAQTDFDAKDTEECKQGYEAMKKQVSPEAYDTVTKCISKSNSKEQAEQCMQDLIKKVYEETKK
jgi:hypothetical protein